MDEGGEQWLIPRPACRSAASMCSLTTTASKMRRQGCRSAAAASTAHREERHGPDGGPEGAPEGFKSAGGVPQTDRTFDEEIVERMGASFYHQVFHPAIAQAFREGKRYEEIRDSIRARWKKAPANKEVSS